MNKLFVLYHADSTRFVRYKGEALDHFASKAAAKGARTRLYKKGLIDFFKVEVAEKGYFHANIEKSEVVNNLMSGKPVTQPVNTPLCCDPSSETYWSM